MSCWEVQESAIWKEERVGFADGYCRFLKKRDCKVSGSRVENGIKAALTDKNSRKRIFSAIRSVFLSRH